jgi:type I restriction enzyme S subunit
MAMELDELPSGWTVKPLRDCVVPKELWNLRRNPRLRIRYVELAGIDNERGVIAEAGDIEASTAPSRAKKVIRAGDVIFATTRPNLKNIAIVPPDLDNEICSTGFCVLRPKIGLVTTEWIFGIVRSDWFINQVVRHDEKNAYPSVSDDEVLAVEIPVPLVVEQRRIMARVEALTRRLDQARQARQAAIPEATSAFQRVLESKFADEATEDWREVPAEKLFEIVSGQASPQDPQFKHLPYLGPEHVESGTGRIIGERVSVEKLEMKSGKYVFSPEHVVYSKIRPALRKVCLPDYHGLCSADMYALKPNADEVTREFLLFLLLAPPFSQYAVEKSDRNAMPKINQTALFDFTFRVPDKPEQKRIAKLLLSLRVKLDELQRLQRDVEAELASFTPALLAKAFRGEL